MKKNSKVIIGILSLIIITLIIFITIILNKSTNIFKLNQSKEQLSTEDGIVTTSEHLEQMSDVYEKGKQEGTESSFTSITTTFYANGVGATGSYIGVKFNENINVKTNSTSTCKVYGIKDGEAFLLETISTFFDDFKVYDTNEYDYIRFQPVNTTYTPSVILSGEHSIIELVGTGGATNIKIN